MDETMARIHQLANERLLLYRLASKQRLTVEQQNRINEISGRLPLLWDQHRRELAASRYAPKITRLSEAPGRRAA